MKSIARLLNKHHNKKLMNETELGSDELTNKLLDATKSKNKDFKVVNMNHANSMALIPGKTLKERAKGNKEVEAEVRRRLASKLPKEVIDNLGSDAILLGNNKALRSSAVVAHELGHRHYFRDKDAGLIGKVSHKVSPYTSAVVKVAPKKAVAVMAGNSAYKKAINDYKGKKTSTLTKVSGNILPAMAIPGLVTEASASIWGYNQLKKHGATNAQLKGARRQLGHAFGTYVSNALPIVSSALIGKLMGKGLAKATILKELKKQYPQYTLKQLDEVYKKEKLKNKAKPNSSK